MHSLNLFSLRPSLPYRLCAIALASAFAISGAIAQEANVLGLPAVPQPKPGAAPASAPKPASASGVSPDSPASRDALAGEMGLQHSALGGLGRVVFTTKATYATAGARSSAMDAAKAVQRDLIKACAKQCKPEKMAAPKILSSGQLEFDLAFRPLYQHLNQAQFMALLQSKPLNLTPAQLADPNAAATPMGSATAAPTTATK